MNIRIILIGIFFLIFSNNYGQQYQVYSIVNSVDLTGFESFIDQESFVPHKKITYHQKRNYSPDKNYYIEYTSISSLALKRNNGEIITEIEQISPSDIIIWLKGCVIIDRFNNEPNKKILVNVYTGKKTIYKTSDKFRHIGQSDTVCYFYSFGDYSYFDTLFLKSRNSIVALNEKGASVEYRNPTVVDREMRKSEFTGKNEWKYMYSDSIITFDYYNKQLSTGHQNIGNVMATRYFRNYDSTWVFSDYVPFFYMDSHVSFDNGYTYALINNEVIYRFGQYEIVKLLDCKDFNIAKFIIKDNFLIFSSKTPTNKRPVGIFNIETEKLFYPKVARK